MLEWSVRPLSLKSSKPFWLETFCGSIYSVHNAICEVDNEICRYWKGKSQKNL